MNSIDNNQIARIVKKGTLHSFMCIGASTVFLNGCSLFVTDITPRKPPPFELAQEIDPPQESNVAMPYPFW